MTRFVAVIDLGKSNSKVALVDTQTAEEIELITQAAVVDCHGNYPSIDHVAIKSFVVDSLAKLTNQHPVDGITVATHGATVALIDDKGDLALPVLDYEYEAVERLRSSYNEYRPSFSDTGSPSLPGGLNVGAQLFWQQHHYPKQFLRAVTVLTWPQYWVHLLTGERHNDVTSLGCHTDLYEPRQQRYSSLISSMGWQKLMPTIKQSGELSGAITSAFAKQAGLSKSLPVYSGIHDSNASLVPHLIAQEAPFTVVSTGTWFIVMAVGGLAIDLDESKDTLLNVNARGEVVPSARFMGGRERDLLSSSNVVDCEQGLDELLSNIDSAAMLMPSTVTDTGPYPSAKACWINKPAQQDGAVRNSAVALYLALMTHECMQLVGSAGPTFIEGPLARDQQFAQMLAVVSERPVMLSGAQTGTSVGAAMLINAPAKAPVYEAVTLDSLRLDKLVSYAALWKQRLHDHAR